MGIFSFFASFGVISAALADSPALFCRQTHLRGLFEQCEEVKVLKVSLDRAQIYSLAEKAVKHVAVNQLFTTSSWPKDQTKEQRIVAVPEKILWNTSKQGFQSLCQAAPSALKNGKLSKDYLTIQCGRYQNETVRMTDVYALTPLSLEQSLAHQR